MEEPSFSTDQEALDHFRSLARSLQNDLDETKSALDEFQISSKELENELENELQSTEKQLKDLRVKEENLTHEIDQWKNKYHSSLRDHTKTMTHMQTEIEALRKSNEEYRTRLRDMELDNDELEGKERMVTSSLQDVENKYGKAIERITLLEDELIEKSKLEEECQRLKDDLRDMAEEIAVLRDQQANLPVSALPTPQLTTSRLVSPRDSPEATPSESVMEVLKDPKEMTSPIRVMGKVKAPPLSTTSENSPRRRLVSHSANSSPSREISSNAKSAAWSSRKAATLRVKSPLGTAKPGLQEILSPNSRIPAPGNLGASSLSRSSTRREPNMTNSHTFKGVSATNGRSHLQSLKAETQRLQGMTKKLVSSRTLRQVSAIPVPKTLGLSQSTSSRAGNLSNLNQNSRSSNGLNETRRLPSGATGTSLRSITHPPTSQDKESDLYQIELSRSNSTSAMTNASSSGTSSSSTATTTTTSTTTTTKVPRPKQSFGSNLTTTARLSLEPEQHKSLGIPILLERSITSSSNNINRIPRRKVSMEITERFVRPVSVQENYKSHNRRKSTGFSLRNHNQNEGGGNHEGFDLMRKSQSSSVTNSSSNGNNSQFLNLINSKRTNVRSGSKS